MNARRLTLATLASLCGLVCALAIGAGSSAAATTFGEYGTEAGQLRFPAGVAADAAGDVYVANSGDSRVDKLTGSGSPILAWGAGVLDGANELQTCTTSCERGLPGFLSGVTGGFEFPDGVAVDNELSSMSYGDVYVVDYTRARVEKYDPAGKFLLMFGGHVNQTTGANVCVAGETCKVGVEGTGDGEFSYWPTFTGFIASFSGLPQ